MITHHSPGVQQSSKRRIVKRWTSTFAKATADRAHRYPVHIRNEYIQKNLTIYQIFLYVPRAGFEPAIHGLKTRCPRPLDERGVPITNYFMSYYAFLTLGRYPPSLKLRRKRTKGLILRL